MTSRGRDEAAHPPGAEAWWTESWYVDFASDDGETGGFVRLGVLPNQRRAWCWLYIVTPDGTVVVRDHEAPLPPADHLLARSEGLWCELVCEAPMEHWAVNAEAFGVRLDDPLDGYQGEIGHRIAVGLELDWETTGPPVDHTEPSGGYAQPGVVHGEILLGSDVLSFAGTGMRDHSWGVVDWWAHDRHAVTVGFDAVDGVNLVPLAYAHIPLDAPDGRRAQLARALCRFESDGRPPTHGWAEWLHVT